MIHSPTRVESTIYFKKSFSVIYKNASVQKFTYSMNLSAGLYFYTKWIGTLRV